MPCVIPCVENDPRFKGGNRLDSLSSMYCKGGISLLLVGSGGTKYFLRPTKSYTTRLYFTIRLIDKLLFYVSTFLIKDSNFYLCNLVLYREFF